MAIVDGKIEALVLVAKQLLLMTEKQVLLAQPPSKLLAFRNVLVNRHAPV